MKVTARIALAAFAIACLASTALAGPRLGGAVGLGYVRSKGPITRDWVKDGTYEVDVAGTRIPARVSLASLYDPKRERILV